MELDKCKYYNSKKKGICKLNTFPTGCGGNKWYCDWVKERRNAETKQKK